MRISLLIVDVLLAIPAALFASPDPAPSPCDDDVATVVAAALAQAQIPTNYVDNSAARARWSALIPQVTANINQMQGFSESFDLRPDQPDQIDTGNRLSVGWYIRAAWNLDRLLYDSREVGIQRVAQRLRLEKQQTANDVIDLYFERQFLRRRLASLGTNSADVDLTEKWDELRQKLARTTAKLDAATNGLCRQRISRP